MCNLYRFAIATLSLIACSCSSLPADTASPADREVDFKRDIRPILSNRCFACHGPDEEKVESGLRLDSFEKAVGPADSGTAAVVPGKAEASEMIRRIVSSDDDERMPPPHFASKLTEDEVAKLKKWIDQGAKYTKHWSFDALEVPTVVPVDPPEAFQAWRNSSIDQLVLRQLTKKGWLPSRQADKSVLLRRLSIDLTGLPPSLQEQHDFLQEDSPLSYERTVDRLLSSPAFGEHWARKWLDMARYADSAGYADDPPRTIWGYRDWVIRALNEGMPFDQFTLEQLAADLLPNPTEDQLVATAFHRNTLTNNEGGTNDEEFRNVAVVDRVNTTMAVWMGVTMACAQCHSHKYDPITHKEYFQVFAILNQSQDADRRDESPLLSWFTPEQRRMRDDLLKEQEFVRQQLEMADESMKAKQIAWEKELTAPVEWAKVFPSKVTAKTNSSIAIDDSGKIRVQNDADKDVYTIEWPIADVKLLQEWSGLAIRTVPDETLPGGGAAIGNGNFVLTDVRAKLVPAEKTSIAGQYVRIELPGANKILSLAEVQVFSDDENIARKGTASQINESHGGVASRAVDGNTTGDYEKNSVTHTETCDSPWWELDLLSNQSIDKIIVWNRTDNALQSRLAGAKVRVLNAAREEVYSYVIENPKASQTVDLLPSIEIPWIVANADFAQEKFDAKLAIDADKKSGWAVGDAINKPHELVIAVDGTKWLERLKNWNRPGVIRLSLEFQSEHRRHVLASFRIATTNDARATTLMSLPVQVQQWVRKPATERSNEESTKLHQYYVAEVSPERKPLRERRDALAKLLTDLKPATTVPVMAELPLAKGRETFVQLRGNYRVHGERVEPGLPVAFHPYKNDSSKTDKLNRLDLARWLVQKDNPLTARVIANRYWETLFGVGIVRTSEEFGSQGDLPSNPELLDYLANELMELKWDTKKFLRMLVMSAAYQQTSSVTTARFEEDPENIFVSRGPRFRATAEQIRDNALAAGGLLSMKMFGPPTRPPQPNLGLKAAFGSNTDWETSMGGDRFRRAIYTQWRRSSPYPSMATFDAPNREVCVLKRDRTNTPLQALVTLNDPVFIEAAQGLARRVVLVELPKASNEERIARIFEHALARLPAERETKSVLQLLDVARVDLESAADRALKLATDPIGPLPDGASTAEMAAWTTVCNVVLNLDEFLMKP